MTFKFIDQSRILSFSSRGITLEEASKLHFPQDSDLKHEIHHITCVDGKYYYFKSANTVGMINELLGSFYASLINLDSVDYHIGFSINNYSFYLLSKIFYEEGYLYEKLYRRGKRNEKFFREQFFDDSELCLYQMEPAYLEMLKLAALDLFMHNTDRYNCNLILKRKDGKIYLSKVFDYGKSFTSHGIYYENSLFGVQLTPEGLSNLFSRYPLIYLYLKQLFSITMEEALAAIEKKHGIKLDEELKKYYLEKYHTYQDELCNPKIRIYM